MRSDQTIQARGIRKTIGRSTAEIGGDTSTAARTGVLKDPPRPVAPPTGDLADAEFGDKAERGALADFQLGRDQSRRCRRPTSRMCIGGATLSCAPNSMVAWRPPVGNAARTVAAAVHARPDRMPSQTLETGMRSGIRGKRESALKVEIGWSPTITVELFLDGADAETRVSGRPPCLEPRGDGLRLRPEILEKLMTLDQIAQLVRGRGPIPGKSQ